MVFQLQMCFSLAPLDFRHSHSHNSCSDACCLTYTSKNKLMEKAKLKDKDMLMDKPYR